MMTREGQKNRKQIQIMSLDDLVPQDHLVRKLETALDWSFIYELVAEKYSEDSGRPSIDPVVLIKLLVIQYMFGRRAMQRASSWATAYIPATKMMAGHFLHCWRNWTICP